MTDDGRSLTVDQLADRWQRRPQWITKAARRGEIPGAWKLGHVWRFFLAEIEAFEEAQKTPSIFALSPGAAARWRNRVG
ncbi:MAG: helix-turn-helix domain-containing protein [Arthrobacter sp.]